MRIISRQTNYVGMSQRLEWNLVDYLQSAMCQDTIEGSEEIMSGVSLELALLISIAYEPPALFPVSFCCDMLAETLARSLMMARGLKRRGHSVSMPLLQTCVHHSDSLQAASAAADGCVFLLRLLMMARA